MQPAVLGGRDIVGRAQDQRGKVLAGEPRTLMLRRCSASASKIRCAQPALLHNLAAPWVDEAQVGVPVAEIQSGCHLWFAPATNHGGPILLSIMGVRARIAFADPKGTA